MEEFTALITDERRRFNATSAIYNGLKNGEDPVQLIIQCEADEIVPGQNYRFTGVSKFSARWGYQFHVQEFIEAVPMSQSAVVYYLSKLPGIGQRTAAKIYEHYGENTLDKIIENPEYLTQLPRINLTKAQAIATLIRGDIEMVQTKIELQAYLQGSGFPRSLAEKLYRRYGAVVIQVIQRNPYLLLNYDGCGFQSVDRFALKNGFNPLRLKRQALFLLYMMDQSQDVWFPLPELRLMLIKQFGSGARVKETLKLLKLTHRIAARKTAPDGTPLHEWQIARKEDEDAETIIATSVIQHASQANFPVKVDTSSLTESQKEALAIATTKRVGCFVGGPGTGKTYSVARYIQGICDQYGED
ncbi:MAG: helix-hairpin-helix domain-containing protein, partial [Thermoguttaceae bacterium]